MSVQLHAAIKANPELHRLMNCREGDWALINGQLARMNNDKIVRFEKMTFRLRDRRVQAKVRSRRA